MKWFISRLSRLQRKGTNVAGYKRLIGNE